MGKERLKGLNALITGASRGIGRAIALKYADEGADLFLAATKRENLENVATEISSLGRQVFTYELDVSDRKQAVQMVDQAILDLGRIDILINNAGVYKPARFVDYSPEDFDRIIQVNLYGAFHVLQLVVRNMIKEGTGSVINIASTAGKWGSMNQSAYNTSKHGLVGLTRCVALETAAAGLRVNAICPGFVETDLLNELKTHAEINGMSENEFRELAKSRVPMRRFMKSEEIADLAIFLGSDESSGMTGQSLLIDGGMVLV
ncbi:SDR family oxidoreductase [Myxococcota bacterium]|jgi:NAD(P)-dependent dehydrogenase (short-subunit alcohol dehydrogenase family)|nr:SDR family oxidoreductase [Myxococcota bacterium]|tara:strand:+ start:84 stop:866 length:783 start_codon:yes stop_codon:yes gene_type:complete